jgi:hypothetical protein
VLTGQGRFQPHHARGFATTPQRFLFGVCGTETMDVITPLDISQSNKPDYTVHSPGTPEGIFLQ